LFRVLQLLDLDCDFETESLADLLRDQLGRAFSVTRQIVRDNPASSVGAVMSIRKQRGAFDLLHAFSPRALAIAAMVGGKIVYSPSRFPTREQIRWTRAVMHYRDVQLICPTDTMCRAYVSRGVPIKRCHLVRPAVQFAKINRRRDDGLRRALGFSSNDHIVLAGGESVRGARHDLALWTASILHVLDPKFRFLLWGRGESAATVINVNRKSLKPELMSVAEEKLKRRVRFEELLPAADSVLITANRPIPTLPICISMAAALPIVSTISTTVCELLEDRHNAILVNSDKPRIIAQKLIDLIEDSSLQWKLADMARTEAYEYFSQTRLLNQYRALFSQVIEGSKVEIPLPAAGAGLRFHGLM
jgi:glycosyltransferase involved in cell wall biosynthesis